MAKDPRSRNWQPPTVIEVDSDEEKVIEGLKDAVVQVEDKSNKPTQKPTSAKW